ncbi:MAG: DUF4058 family protein [Pirellulaceae bacterium]
MASKSPFPGVDPYIEARGLWEEFHEDFIQEIKRRLSVDLPPNYVARSRSRNYVELVDPVAEGLEKRGIIPDVALHEELGEVSHSVWQPASDLAVSEPVTMTALAEVDIKENAIDILKVEPDFRLVTCIEVLSPTNKRPGTAGWNEFREKRSMLLGGLANYVEIDLLRRGKRHGMVPPWPDSPYYLMVMRKEETPRCSVWPAFSTRPLDNIPIPLLPPDADIVLPLQPLVDNVFASLRYFQQMNYERPITLKLTAEEQELVLRKA